jgi:hypothetical protein
LERQVKTLQEQVIQLSQENEALNEKNKQLENELKTKQEENEKLKQAKASNVRLASASGNCEVYRPIVAKYDWEVETAMLVMDKESGCVPTKISSTQDHGLFQLHQEPIYDPEANVARAYQKYVRARRGVRNWSAWYAVCSPSLQPIYGGVKCSS